MEMNKIIIIDNREGRNEQFLPIFNLLSKQYGVLTKNYFIIQSKYNFNVSDDIGILFNSIQHISSINGFTDVMYIIKN